MFERFLYIGNIRSLIKVVRAFGLFLQQGSHMQKYVPDFHQACQYMSFNNQSLSISDRFGKIIGAMKTLSKFSVHIQRLVKKEEFNPSLYFVSVISFWTLSMICYIKASVNNLREFPMLRRLRTGAPYQRPSFFMLKASPHPTELGRLLRRADWVRAPQPSSKLGRLSSHPSF